MIRLMHADDFSAIEVILINTQSDWTLQIIQDCSTEYYVRWVILKGDCVVGFVIVKNNIDSWEIMQIVIDKQYQRQGLAKQLLTHVIMEAKKNHIQKIQLEVRESNHPVISLYKKIGFVETGLRKKYYSNGENAVLFDLIC